MSLPWLSRVSQTQTLVHTDDTAVTPKNGARGWIPIEDATAGNDAVKVTVRPLNGREFMANTWKQRHLFKDIPRDDEGALIINQDTYDMGAASNIERDHARLGMVSIEPMPKGMTLDSFCEWLPQDGATEISNIIAALTQGEETVPDGTATFPDGAGA